jgi:transmembrane sensor
MSKLQQIDRLLIEESAEWTERLKHGDRHTRAAFAKWSRKSPLHMRHFLMMVALDQELGLIDPQKRIPLPDPSERASAEVVDLNTRTIEPVSARKSMLRWWSLAAVVLIGVATLLGMPQLVDRALGWHVYATALGEQRAVELPDGSIAHLNTQSRLRVRISEHEREVQLLTGEALFKVHHDATKPFRVYTDDAMIQAVGTQFNVYRQSAGTTVSVAEGRVRVVAGEERNSGGASSPPDAKVSEAATSIDAPLTDDGNTALLSAGEAIEVRHDGTVTKTEGLEAAAIASWRQRRLVFKQDPLSAVVTEFNRYNRAPQFRIVGADVASRRYSGAFDADDPESLLALLSIDKELTVKRDGDEVIIRARNAVGAFAQSP